MPEKSPACRRWFLEGEVLLLLLLVIGIYFIRHRDLSIRGEESRWTQVACEMLQSGDWVTPRQQGKPFLSRPPLGSWLIALTTVIRGECDVTAIRLASMVAVLLTTLLIYGWSRRYLSRLGALAAGAAFASFGLVLQLGQVAESEAVFTFLLSASLLVWHWGWTSRWPSAITWVCGYGLAGLAALTKGPQAPVYFAGAVTVFLVFTRDWRGLLSWSHALGVLVFLLIVGTWMGLLTWQVGWADACRIWVNDTSMRFHDRGPGIILAHLATYPFEALGAALPWSLLLAAYLIPRFRQTIGSARPMVVFLAICLLVAFPTCWFSPGAIARYFMPLFPCLAPLIGLVVQRAEESAEGSGIRLTWRIFLGWIASVMLLVAAAMAVVNWVPLPLLDTWRQPGLFAAAYCVTVFGLGILLWWCRARLGAGRGQAAVLAIAAFLGLTYAGVFVNHLACNGEDTAGAMASLRSQLPAGQKLVSFRPVHHLFAYYYHLPIELRAWPQQAEDVSAVNYFCFFGWQEKLAPLPFRWEEIAVIPMGRFRNQREAGVMIVGKRLPEQ